MRTTTIVAAVLLLAASVRGQPTQTKDTTRQLLHELKRQGVPVERILGFDRAGIPRVCGTGLAGTDHRAESAAVSPGDLPPGTRSWECIPGVIRNDGVESFRLEVNVNGPVNTVVLDTISNLLVPPSGAPILLLDDGQGADAAAGDGVYTAGPFRFDTAAAIPPFYMNDTSSPAGLFNTIVGIVTVEELDGTQTNFLIAPEVGLLRSDIPDAPSMMMALDIRVSSHLINIRTDARDTQLLLRFLGGGLHKLTNRIYDVMPDVFDFLVFFSSNKIEQLPRTSSPNFTAGVHLQVQTNFTGTGLSAFDGTASYGSNGVLLSVNVLDAYTRGVVGHLATHELTHQWSSFTSASLSLSDGTGHYNARSSAASLVGGFKWIDNGDDTFTLNCNEGRNGAFYASPIDRYMMGLIDGDAVQPLYFSSAINFATDCDQLVEPLLTVGIEDIQNMHGVRSPGPANAQTNFKIAFVVESHARLLNATELTFYERLAEHYVRPPPPKVSAPFVGNNWPSIAQYFGQETTWSTAVVVANPSIPAVSAFGMVIMTVLLLAAAIVALRRAR